MTLQDESPKQAVAVARESRVVATVEWLVAAIARHWLALFNMAWGLYLGLALLAPVLMHLGLVGPAQILYSLYSFVCHQLPDHSYFLFGAHPTPLQPELQAGGMAPGLSLWEQRRFVGNPALGYKVAICERDVAIYGSIWLAGLLFVLLRRRLAPLPWRVYLLLIIPMAIDGLTQLVGLRESNWWLRTVTGALFGVATVWLAYPYVEEAMAGVEERSVDAG
ncbi:DUF2085 domain-containing protein [Litorilinea aerophila]|uniref:DUF2085 domain-containing protein n=1 Tax=Litorilinea aerophila TaxID=1204385 RepID=A0A540V9R5_9CHLR|nr:DUF2085 domain-containing protein [Litorilinea aerophila]MCC9078600.1 DUF2085 domain-containing protein [Litorilinea aerophila]